MNVNLLQMNRSIWKKVRNVGGTVCSHQTQLSTRELSTQRYPHANSIRRNKWKSKNWSTGEPWTRKPQLSRSMSRETLPINFCLCENLQIHGSYDWGWFFRFILNGWKVITLKGGSSISTYIYLNEEIKLYKYHINWIIQLTLMCQNFEQIFSRIKFLLSMF